VALEELGDKRAVEPLIHALGDEHSSPSRCRRALGELRDRSAVEPLICALDDREQDVYRAAAYALGNSRQTRCRSAYSALGDRRSFVRITAQPPWGCWASRSGKEWVMGDKGDLDRLFGCRDLRVIEPLIRALEGFTHEAVSYHDFIPDDYSRVVSALGELRDRRPSTANQDTGPPRRLGLSRIPAAKALEDRRPTPVDALIPRAELWTRCGTETTPDSAQVRRASTGRNRFQVPNCYRTAMAGNQKRLTQPRESHSSEGDTAIEDRYGFPRSTSGMDF